MKAIKTLTDLFEMSNQIQDLKQRTISGTIHPSTAMEEILRMKEEFWQNFHNVVDIVITLAKESKMDEQPAPKPKAKRKPRAKKNESAAS